MRPVKQVDNPERYSTKVIKYSEDGPGAYTIMLVLLEGEGQQLLERSGYGGRFLMMMDLERRDVGPEYDPRRFSHKFSQDEYEMMASFFRALSDGRIPFDAIRDGQTIDHLDVQEMLEEMA